MRYRTVYFNSCKILFIFSDIVLNIIADKSMYGNKRKKIFIEMHNMIT